MVTHTWGVGGMVPEGQLNQFDRRLLSRFIAKTVFNKFGTPKGIPRRGGKSISFRKLEVIVPTGNAATWGAQASAGGYLLTEGTPPAATNASWSEVLATVSQYGQYSLISDMAEDQSIDDVTPEMVEAYTESATMILDLATRDVLVAGTNVQYASTAATRTTLGSGMYLTYAELREAKRTLKNQNATPVRSEGGKFVVITNPNAMFDLEADTNVLNIWQNAGPRGDENQLFDVSFKDIPSGFRIYESTLTRVFASAGLSGADVIATLVLAEEAYGKIKLEAMPMRVIRKPRGSGGATGDPLDQVASIGWKASHTAVILQQNAMTRIEHVSSSKNSA